MNDRKKYTKAIVVFLSVALSTACMAQSLMARVINIEQFRDGQNAIAANLDSACTAVDEWSTEGGSAIGYFNPEGELATAHCWAMGESGKWFQSFHFDHDTLVFSLLVDSRYNRPYYWGETERKDFNDTEVFDPAKTTTRSTAYFFEHGAPLCSGPIHAAT
jgi:hypothetical protein